MHFLTGSCRWGDICDRIHPDPAVAPASMSAQSVTVPPRSEFEDYNIFEASFYDLHFSVSSRLPAVKLAVVPVTQALPPTLPPSTQQRRRRGAAKDAPPPNTLPPRLALSTQKNFDSSVQNVDSTSRPSFIPAFSMKPIIVNYQGKVNRSPISPSRQLPLLPIANNGKGELCRDYLRGHCFKGRRCRYVHSNEIDESGFKSSTVSKVQ